MQAAQDDKRASLIGRKADGFEVGNRVMLKVSPLERGCTILTGLLLMTSFRLRGTIKITDREVKRLKRSRIPLVKVRWNSKRGPAFTWEREDQFRKKYPHLFSKEAAVVKCCVLSLEDKSQLTGGDYNTPCFRTMYDVNKVTIYF
ncbi:hypothetical protein Tco_0537773 [Tanacetum coccineum]